MKNYAQYFLLSFIVLFAIFFALNFTIVEKFTITTRNACVINLKRRPDRLKKFRNMSRYASQCEVVSAVDGRTLDLQSLLADGTLGYIGWKSIVNTTQGLPKKHHYELCTLGAIGCYLSHYNAWKSILDHKLAYRYIFEDDANITILDNQDYVAMIAEKMQTLPDDWHIYLIGLPHTMLEFEDCDNCDDNLKKIKRFCGLHAYIVSFKGAKFLLEQGMLFPIQQQIDSHLSELALDYGLNVYIHTDVPLIRPIEDKTDIQVDSFTATDDRLRIQETM